MKVLLVLVTLVAVAYAGVGILFTGRAAAGASLLLKFCGGNSSDHVEEGHSHVFCKISSDDSEESAENSVALKPGTNSSDDEQVIFVKPPSKKYKHRITISNKSDRKPQATIYVLPQNDTHSVEVVDDSYSQQEESVRHPSPRLFFLTHHPAANNNPEPTESENISSSLPESHNNTSNTNIAVSSKVQVKSYRHPYPSHRE